VGNVAAHLRRAKAVVWEGVFGELSTASLGLVLHADQTATDMFSRVAPELGEAIRKAVISKGQKA
jgi:catalase